MIKISILEYFIGDVIPGTSSIQPEPITSESFEVEGQMNNSCHSLISNDGAYFIRYGGLGDEAMGSGDYNSIQVFNNQSLEDKEVLYSFNNLKINNHPFMLIDLHQDEDGRFYGIGKYTFSNLSIEYYLIIFNNFIQDGVCKVNKFYKNSTMGTSGELLKVAKNSNLGEYYMLSTNKIFAYKIDIVEGNSLTTYNLGSSISPSQTQENFDLFVVDNDLVAMQVLLSSGITCQKVIINLNKEVQNSYSFTTIYQDNTRTYVNFPIIENRTFKIPYSTESYKFNYLIIDMNGNVVDRQYTSTNFSAFYARIRGDYISIFEINDGKLTVIWDQGTRFKVIYTEDTEFNTFLGMNLLKQFDLNYLIGFDFQSDISYIKIIHSPGYSSVPGYYSINTLIPQYLNLFPNTNDDTSMFYSRDVSNRFLTGNQLTTTFHLPYYLLNDKQIKREVVYGQTNIEISDISKNYQKNRFEDLYFTYIYSINIIDNTNGDNFMNYEGSNRFANSIWNLLDYQASPLMKARITYADETQEIINITPSGVGVFEKTYNFSVTGNVTKIEYISNDENTVYASYRCNLTGTNSISQKIRIQGG